MDTAVWATDAAGTTRTAAEQLFAGPGEMRARCRTLDWAATPLGPVDGWPQSLRSAVDACLDSPLPGFVWWGPEHVQLYNDAALALVGARHPQALGAPAREVCSDVWDVIGPLTGGVREPARCTFSYGAVRDESGAAAGLFVTGVETTTRSPAPHRRPREASSLASRGPAGAGESEERYRRLFESIDEGYALCELLVDDGGLPVDVRFLDVNAAFGRLSGLSGAAGRTARELSLTVEPYWLDAARTVVEAGEPVRLEAHVAGLHRWLDVHFSRIGGAGGSTFAVVFQDTTARRQAEAVLRESGARQAYLLALGDALRDIADPIEIQSQAARILGEQLAADRVYYAEIDVPKRRARVYRDYRRRSDAASVVGWHEFVDYPTIAATVPAGHSFIEHDVAWSDSLLPEEKATLLALEIAAIVVLPLMKAGAMTAELLVTSDRPRSWTDADLALIEETAERTWAAVERARAEAALRESEERHRIIVEGARDYAILTTDTEGRITSWSPGAVTAYGWTAAEAVGRPSAITFTPEDQARGVPEAELANARDEGVSSDVRWHRRRDGAPVFIDGTTRALRDGAGRLRGFLKIGQDVTRRRQMERALRASETRYRTLIENVRDYAIFMLDVHGVITEWTSGAERVTGYRPDEVVGRHVALFYTPEDVAAGEPARELAEAAATGRAEREAWRVRKGGERFWANEIATAVRDGEGRLTGFTTISRDLTERRLAEAAAEQARVEAERIALRRQLVQAEEEERRRLARELHDEAGQHLTALGLGLQSLTDVVPAGSEVDRRAEQLRALASTLGRELHALAVRLRPRALDDFGLEAAIGAHVEEWSRQCGIAADVHARVEPERLPAAVESAVYRVVQEALTNVAKHSGATRASVVVERRDGQVVAVVEDDGRGFDAAALAERPAGATGLGLLGVRERVALLGGTVDVESAPGAGTTIFVRIPIDVSGRRPLATRDDG